LALPCQFDYHLIQNYLKDQLQQGLLALLMSSHFSSGSELDGRKLRFEQHEHYYDIDYEVTELPAAGKTTPWSLHPPTHLEVSLPKQVMCPGCSVDPALVNGLWFLVIPSQFDTALHQPQASLSILFPVSTHSLETVIQGELYALQLYIQLSEILARDLLAGSTLEVSWTP